MSPPVQAKAAQGTVTATLRIPAVKRAVRGRRTPLWIPAAAQGVAVTFWPQGGSEPSSPSAVFDVSATSASCTTDSTGRTCILHIAAPPGPTNALLYLYDAKPSGGAPQGNPLAIGLATVTIVANTSNALSIVAFGVPASLAVTPVAITSGVASDVTPLIIVADAAGDIILTDSYSTTITVAVNNDPDHRILPASVDLNGPAESATFHYDGGAFSAQPNFSASGVNVTAGTNIVVRPSPTPSPSPTPAPVDTPTPTPVPIADSPIVACMSEGIALTFPAGVTGDTPPTAVTLSGTGLRACEFLPNGHLLWIDSTTVHEADFTTGADLRTLATPANPAPSLADVTGDFNNNIFASTTGGLVYGWSSIAVSGDLPTFSLVNGTDGAGLGIDPSATLWALNPTSLIPSEVVPSYSAFTSPANVVIGPGLQGSRDIGFDNAGTMYVGGTLSSDVCLYTPTTFLGGTACSSPATNITLPGVTPRSALAVDNAGVFYRNGFGPSYMGIYVMSAATGSTPMGIISGPNTLLDTYTLVDLAVAPGYSVPSRLTSAKRITDTVLRRPKATRASVPRAPLHDEASRRGR